MIKVRKNLKDVNNTESCGVIITKGDSSIELRAEYGFKKMNNGLIQSFLHDEVDEIKEILQGEYLINIQGTDYSYWFNKDEALYFQEL